MNRYHFQGSTDFFEADADGLRQRLERERQRLADYEDLAVDQSDDDAYVARGNGFCDSKYSPEFVDAQIREINHRISQLQSWIDGTQL